MELRDHSAFGISPGTAGAASADGRRLLARSPDTLARIRGSSSVHVATDRLVPRRPESRRPRGVASDNLSLRLRHRGDPSSPAAPGLWTAAFSLALPSPWPSRVLACFSSPIATIKAYPQSGGRTSCLATTSPLPAQVSVSPSHRLHLTVSVSVSAGTAALTSLYGRCSPLAWSLLGFSV